MVKLVIGRKIIITIPPIYYKKVFTKEKEKRKL